MCKVVKVSRFGISVAFDEVEGIVHVSELGDGTSFPGEVVAPGEVIDAVVLHVDPWERKIALSVKGLKATA